MKIRSVVVLIIFWFIIGCSNHEEFPSGFNFIFEYGVMNKNILNTFEETYTKDLVLNGVTTTELVLTKEEKKQIFEYMRSINLFVFPSEIEGMKMEPTSGYRFDIQYNGKRKIINWKGEFKDRTRDREFKELTRYIIKIIKSKEAYKSLPAGQGGYE